MRYHCRMSSAPGRLIVAAGLVWPAPSRLLVQRRPPAGHGAGRLELPGGKVEPGEAPADALRRELREEWGPAAELLRVGPIVEVLHHVYPPPGPEVLLLIYHVDASALAGGPARPRWSDLLQPAAGAILEFEVADLPLEDFLEADRTFLTQVRLGRVPPPFLGFGPG